MRDQRKEETNDEMADVGINNRINDFKAMKTSKSSTVGDDYSTGSEIETPKSTLDSITTDLESRYNSQNSSDRCDTS
jgi:hypothetical protein